ncbi:MAG TPA: GNAT family N-acetyltransferase [Chthoniobacteraceae bacterium]|nr:GNAT family N-acetyltransferase [Chthoniobacteraceae bacterium]
MTALPELQAPRRSPDAVEFTTSFGRAFVVTSSEDIDPQLRQEAFAGHCKDFRYYEIAEACLEGQFEHRYFVLENETTGETAIQPFFFVDQDVTAGLPASLRGALVAPLRKLWPRFLNLRMLMVGCSAAEGHLDKTHPWAVQALHETLDLYMRHAGAAIVLLKDFPANYREALQRFSQDGYRRVPSMPGARLDLDFASFEEYMQTRLSKVYRKNLRRKFKALKSAPPVEMEVLNDAAHLLDEIYALHLQTYHRSEFKFEELTRDYFRLIGQRMPDRVRFFVWRQNGRLVAFNLCLFHEGTLYDLDVGLDYDVALDLHLYFVTWRDVIEWGLENGVKTYHTGPLNYDPKLHLRLDLAPQDLYARHSSPLINPLFKLAVEYLQPARHDKTLRRFRNAHEL